MNQVMDKTPLDWQKEPEDKRKKIKYIFIIVLMTILLLMVGIFVYLRWLRVSPAMSESSVTKVLRGTVSSHLKSPLDVALFGGKFYVTDAGNHRVVVFLENGDPLYAFAGGRSPHDVQGSSLVYPAGIDVNSKGEIFVADSGGGKVVVFNETGRALRLLKLPSGKRLLKPLALTVDKQNNIYVSEATSGNIYKFNQDEKIVKVIGEGELSFANGIAVDDNDEIYVSDSNNQRIIVYNKLGKVIQTIGRRRGNKSFLPRGIVIDKGGDLLVADTLGFQIIELNKMGHEITTWGKQGHGKEEFNFPNGMAYSRQGLLYIADRGNDRVVIWRHLP